MWIPIVLKCLGALALLIYGMKIMSEALQKQAGSGLRRVVRALTKGRIKGLFTGIIVTSAVQSSTATTVMTVSFVSAGLLSLSQAICVIMGANIGTTLTAWIMSAGLSFNIIDFVWPAFLVGIVLIYLRRRRYIGDLLFGVAFMILSLGVLSALGKEMDLQHNQTLIHFFGQFNHHSYSSVLLFLLFGTIITCIVQSSAAVMAITMMLCSGGVLPVYLGVALVMGENIGTTLTANIVSMGAGVNARRAALAHLVFNVFGVMWVLCVFYPFVDATIRVVGITSPTVVPSPVQLSMALAVFHTAFNVTNTAVLIGFVPQIEKLVCKLVKAPNGDEEDEERLRYLNAGLMRTPEIMVVQAEREIALFATRMVRAFSMTTQLLETSDSNERESLMQRIAKYERIADHMEVEIAHYLEQVSHAHLSDESKQKIHVMWREVSELESIGDSCLNVARAMERKVQQRIAFSEAQSQALREMTGLVKQLLDFMTEALSKRKEEVDIYQAFPIEKQINDCRLRLKRQNIADVDAQVYSYAAGTVYMDVVEELERLGDYTINVVEARAGLSHRAIEEEENSHDVLRYRGLVMVAPTKVVRVDGKEVSLTKTEFELLRFLIRGENKVFSREELLHAVWPQGTQSGLRTVDVTVARIRSKIAPYGAQLVARSGYGYCFQAAQEAE